MEKKAKRERVRICLDCKWMKHSGADWERGRCMFYDKEIGYVNNHDWCKHWGRFNYYNDDMEDEYDDSPLGSYEY